MSRLIDADDLLAKRPCTICGGDLSEYDEGYLDAIPNRVTHWMPLPEPPEVSDH